MSPRFLTSWGWGYDVGGQPLFGYTANDFAAFRQDWPAASSASLTAIGGEQYREFYPGSWSPASNGVRYTFPSSGSTSVTDSRGSVITCPHIDAIYDTFALSPNTDRQFHYTIQSANDVDGFWGYNDETFVWNGLYAGMRAHLWSRRALSGMTYSGDYDQSDYNLDMAAYDAAVEGVTHVFDGLHAAFPASKWCLHIWPLRSQNTTAISFLSDLDFGQSQTGGSTARWGNPATLGNYSGDDYRGFWLETAEIVMQPVADRMRWLSPRCYMDERLRNPDLYGSAADSIRASWLLMWEDICELSVKLARQNPVYAAVIATHPGRDIVPVDNPSLQGWYKHVTIDMESWREQARAIAKVGARPAFWSPEEYYASRACLAGIDPGTNDAATNERSVFRLRIKRRFPGLFDNLPDPTLVNGVYQYVAGSEADLAWRSTEVWNIYMDAALVEMTERAKASVFAGAAKQSTLLAMTGG